MTSPNTLVTILERKDIPLEKTWDLSNLYPSDQNWEKDFDKVESHLKALDVLCGKLGESVKNLAKVIELKDLLDREITKLYVYTHLRSDEDSTNTHYMGMKDRIHSRANRIQAGLSWIEPEIMAIPQEKIQTYLKSPEMKPYLRYMEVLLRQKPHLLSTHEETLLSLAAEPLSTMGKTFNMLNNADLKFEDIENEDGKKVPVTHGSYIRYLESPNRTIRKRAFESVYSGYSKLKNTFCSTIDGQVKSHVFWAKARKHPNALKAALFDDNVDPKVYTNLISTIHAGLPSFHKYVQLRADQLKLKELDMFDQYVSIVPDYQLDVPYEQACKWILEATRCLGEEYSKALERAFTERWIDVPETRNKHSGAYSSGCYDSNPFILMNYNENLHSAFTLAHELGHSLHSYFSNKTQPHIYSHYRIFVAEVASTTNEILLNYHLTETTKDPKLKAYLLNHLCDDFRGTMFRQTMFAEFEKLMHEWVEQGIPLTPDSLSKEYYNLNAKYYGPIVKAEPIIGLEWARIPHFYYNFYVYKYATGYAAAHTLAHRILKKEPGAVEAYLGFLKAGSTKDPIDILRDAGVDLRTPEPIQKALKAFDASIKQLGKLLKA